LYAILSGTQGLQFAQTFFGITISSFSLIGNFFAIVVLSIYWSIDRVHFERLWLSLLPVDARANAREVWRDIENGVGGYIRSEVAQSVLAGVLLGVGFYWMGLPYPILIALVSAVVWLIPWLGAILALIPVLIVGFSVSMPLGLVTSGYTIAVLLLMELFVEPRLFSRSKLSSLLVVLIMIALADALGLIGIILAPPLAAAIQLLFRHFILPGPIKTKDESIRRIADLDSKLIGVQELVADRVESVAPESLSLLERLDSLVADAKKVVAEQQDIRA
jgi:predicted PurR-regulated permease PerM